MESVQRQGRVGSLKRLNTLHKSAKVMPGISIALTLIEASGLSRGTRMAEQVNGLEMLDPKGGSERCLKVREHELTFDVLIMPAGCGTARLWMESKVAGGDYLQIQHLARFCIW